MIPAKHILWGLLLIVFGALVASNPHPTQYGISVPRGAGVVLICAGTILIVYSLIKRKDILKEESEFFQICPRCEETAYAKDVPDLKCPECEVDLENLEGYYDRHPELKQKANDQT